MLDDMQFLDINDEPYLYWVQVKQLKLDDQEGEDQDESDSEMAPLLDESITAEERELFVELASKFSQRPDLFNFGGYKSKTRRT